MIKPLSAEIQRVRISYILPAHNYKDLTALSFSVEHAFSNVIHVLQLKCKMMVGYGLDSGRIKQLISQLLA